MSSHQYNVLVEYQNDDHIFEFLEEETNLPFDEDDDEVQVAWLFNGHVLVVNHTKHWLINIATVEPLSRGPNGEEAMKIIDFEVVDDIESFYAEFPYVRKHFNHSPIRIDVTVRK